MNAGRVVVIGGAGALGRAACLALAEQGARVTVADLGDPGPVAAALPGIGHAGLTLDICDAEAVAAAFGEQAEYDGLVFAAGANTTGPVSDLDWADYDRVMAVNLRGAFHVGAAISRNLRARPRPFAAVFYSSTAGLRGEYGASVYAATKFGLIGFVQCLAAEIAEFGGRANAICPGNVRSPMLHALASEVAARSSRRLDDVLSEFAEASAFKRLIDPAEVAAASAFLISPAASGISGQTLVVDGAPR